MRSYNLCEGGHALRITFGITMLAVLLLASSVGAVPVEEWNKTFGGTSDDYAVSVQQNSDGGYILAGTHASNQAWLIKTNSNGNELWNKTLNGLGASYGQQISDGGYILVGGTDPFWLSRRIDAWLIKTDSNGNELWNKTFGGTSDDFAYSVQQTSDGGYALAMVENYSDFVTKVWLIKTDANGNTQWNRAFVRGTDNRVNSIRQTSDGGYILSGRTLTSFILNADAWLIKTDANGNEQWNKTFGGTSYDEANSVHQTSDGGYALVGQTGSYGAGDYDAWLIKTDSNGNEQWNKTFGENNKSERGRNGQQTSDGGYILAGDILPNGVVDYDALLIKTDANGNEQWNKTFGGTGFDFIYMVQQISDGNYVLAGHTNSYGAGGYDAWLIKIASEVIHATAGSISGFKVNDTNGNGKWNAGEKGISNWTIRLIGIIGNGKNAEVIRKETSTDATGFYKFDNLSAGRYFVIEKLKKGFVPTSSPVKRMKLAQGKNAINNNFTNRPVQSQDKKDDKRDIDDHEAINRDIDKYKEDMNWN